jgi:hypothetical protein
LETIKEYAHRVERPHRLYIGANIPNQIATGLRSLDFQKQLENSATAVPGHPRGQTKSSCALRGRLLKFAFVFDQQVVARALKMSTSEFAKEFYGGKQAAKTESGKDTFKRACKACHVLVCDTAKNLSSHLRTCEHVVKSTLKQRVEKVTSLTWRITNLWEKSEKADAPGNSSSESTAHQGRSLKRPRVDIEGDEENLSIDIDPSMYEVPFSAGPQHASAGSSSDPISEQPEANRRSEIRKRANQPSLEECIQRSVQLTMDAHHAFVRMVVSCNLPLSIVSNTEFRRWAQKYVHVTIPTKHQMDRLVGEVDTHVREEIDVMLAKADHISLASDSWTNLRNESLTNYVAHLPTGPVFMQARENLGNTKDGVYVGKQILEVIEQMPEDAREKVVALVTDNASVMKSAWQVVHAARPNIDCVGCHAHGINLYFNDVFSKLRRKLVQNHPPHVPTVLQQDDDAENCSIGEADFVECLNENDEVEGNDDQRQARSSWKNMTLGSYSLPEVAFISSQIAQFFKNSSKSRQILLDEQKRMGISQNQLQLPGATRWGSVVRCIKGVVQNKQVIQRILHRSSGFPELIQRLRKNQVMIGVVADEEFWRVADMCVSAFDPVVQLLALLESDHATLGLAFHCMAMYEEFLPQTDLFKDCPEISALWKGRRSFMYSPIAVASYILDPRFRGRKLTQDQKKQGIDWIGKRAPTALGELASWLNETLPHELETAAWETSPVAWWTLKSGTYDGLIPIAQRVLSVPCNSASSERIWSNFSMIHSKIRNRLTAKKSITLVRMYAWYHLKNRKTAKTVDIDALRKFTQDMTKELTRDIVINIDELLGTGLRAAREEEEDLD